MLIGACNSMFVSDSRGPQDLATGRAAWTGTQPLTIARGAHTVQWVCAKGLYAPGATCTGWDQILAAANCSTVSCVCNFDVLAPGAAAAAGAAATAPAVLSSNQQLLAPPGDLQVVRDTVVTAVVGYGNFDVLGPFLTHFAVICFIIVNLMVICHPIRAV